MTSAPEIDKDKITELLVEKHDFSAERINLVLDKFDKPKQKSLTDF